MEKSKFFERYDGVSSEDFKMKNMYRTHRSQSQGVLNCPFCEIDRKKTKIILTKKQTYVAFSNPRLVPGHLLVIPKRHVEKLSDLTPRELNELCTVVIDFQEKIIATLAPGCDIRQNYRPFLKQGRLKVNHLHIHLLPRSNKDELFQKTQLHEKNLFKNLNDNERMNVLSLLTL